MKRFADAWAAASSLPGSVVVGLLGVIQEPRSTAPIGFVANGDRAALGFLGVGKERFYGNEQDQNMENVPKHVGRPLAHSKSDCNAGARPLSPRVT